MKERLCFAQRGPHTRLAERLLLEWRPKPRPQKRLCVSERVVKERAAQGQTLIVPQLAPPVKYCCTYARDACSLALHRALFRTSPAAVPKKDRRGTAEGLDTPRERTGGSSLPLGDGRRTKAGMQEEGPRDARRRPRSGPRVGRSTSAHSYGHRRTRAVLPVPLVLFFLGVGTAVPLLPPFSGDEPRERRTRDCRVGGLARGPQNWPRSAVCLAFSWLQGAALFGARSAVFALPLSWLQALATKHRTGRHGTRPTFGPLADCRQLATKQPTPTETGARLARLLQGARPVPVWPQNTPMFHALFHALAVSCSTRCFTGRGTRK